LSPFAKARLACHILFWFAVVSARLQRKTMPFPELVVSLGTTTPATTHPYEARTLARAVDRTLRIGERRPRCLVNALVLYRLLREQGDEPELVIGLPPSAAGHQAHAWVELNGVDVGPPPGRSGHESLARFR
jgi:hypothetical protein